MATKQNLKQAAKQRAKSAVKKATTKVKETIAAVPSTLSSTKSTISSVSNFTNSDTSKTALTPPGLNGISPDQIAGILPTFNADSYRINDPLNPPETLPQVSEAQFEKGMTIYQGTQRALKLTGAAFDTARERFTVIGKQTDAFSAGIQTATKFEKAKGNYLDYQGQLETNEQKTIALDVAQYKTATDKVVAGFNKTEMGEKQKQAEISAQKSIAETSNKQSQLDEFRKQVG